MARRVCVALMALLVLLAAAPFISASEEDVESSGLLLVGADGDVQVAGSEQLTRAVGSARTLLASRRPTKKRPTKRRPTKKRPTKKQPTKRRPTKKRPTKKLKPTRRPTKKPTKVPTAVGPIVGKCGISACFLLDQSQSMDLAQWGQEQSFVIAAAKQIAQKSEGISVYSAVKFDSQVQVVVPTLTQDTNAFQKKVSAAKQNRGGTYTAAGLDACRIILEKADPRAPRVIVLTTDGKPTLPTTGPEAASLAVANSAKDDGISIFAVGVKDNPSQSDSILHPGLLRGIASREDFFFAVNDFASLAAAVNSIVPKICSVPVVPKYPPRASSPPPPPSLPPPPVPPPPFLRSCPSGSLLATFDTLPSTFDGAVAVPTNYLSASLNWTNWNVWDAVGYQAIVPTSGFSTGVVSRANVGWNNYAQPAYISAVGGATLDLNFMYGTAGFSEASPLIFNVTGFAGESQVAFAMLRVSAVGPSFLQLPAKFAGLTSIKVTTQDPTAPPGFSTKQQLIVDNMCLTVHAAPPVIGK